jgi:glycine/D-amino acid oxidase-like deaminating enzyme
MFIDYQIAVIGAGIVGASIAARLASSGVSVALIDKGAAGSLGASSYSGGLVRLYDGDPLLMELAAWSIGLMDQGVFAATYASALRRTGAIYRAAPDQLMPICNAIERYASERYPMRLLAGHELDGNHFPRCAAGERINLYEPGACVGNVRQAVAALANLVRREGLLLEHCEVKALECRSHDEVWLSLGEATLRCRAVVVAAGAWSPRWLERAGLQSRSIPLARVLTDGDWSMPVIDEVTQSYGIPLTRRIIQTGCGYRNTAASPETLAPPDARHVEDACARIGHLLQPSSDTPQHRVLDVVPGFDCYSPDGRPVLGFVSGDSPLYLATGMSGLGFKLAPGVAQIACEQLQGRLAGATPPAHWSAFSPTRLMHGSAAAASHAAAQAASVQP